MEVTTLNIWAVLVATLSTFVVGWLWYGPLFGKAWMTALGVTEEQLQQGNPAKIFGLTFIFELIMAFNLAMFISDPAIGAVEGAFYGFLVGFGWIFLATAVNGLFEQRSWKYTLINGGYWTISFTFMGLILGAWK